MLYYIISYHIIILPFGHALDAWGEEKRRGWSEQVTLHTVVKRSYMRVQGRKDRRERQGKVR